MLIYRLQILFWNLKKKYLKSLHLGPSEGNYLHMLDEIYWKEVDLCFSVY